MSLGVLNNLSAIYAENNLNNTNNSLNTVLQQLSSGSKINSGADDAAGLSLVDGLQANSVALAQSQTNASEGVGLLTVADGALSQVTNLLNRAVTLATEASNGTLNSSQDTAANQEYQSILSEVNNIGTTTTYNNQAVFNSKNDIYTGDSSAAGASIDALNISSLSSSNLGDTGGVMAYSNGQNSVFINLSSSTVNAQSTDALNTGGTTSINVNYQVKGADGAETNASTSITVGGTTGYQNTATGLVDAINDAGLGLSANFTTQSQAGVAGGGTQTGIQITGGLVSVGVDPGAVSTSGTLNLTGTSASGLLTQGQTVSIQSGTGTAISVAVTPNMTTLGDLATAINNDSAANANTSATQVVATVVTNSQGVQSLSLQDQNPNAGALAVTVTAGSYVPGTSTTADSGAQPVALNVFSDTPGTAGQPQTGGTGGTDAAATLSITGTNSTSATLTGSLILNNGNGNVTFNMNASSGTNGANNVYLNTANSTLAGLQAAINNSGGATAAAAATLGMTATATASGLSMSSNTVGTTIGGTASLTASPALSVTGSVGSAAAIPGTDGKTTLSMVGGNGYGYASPGVFTNNDTLTGSIVLQNGNVDAPGTAITFVMGGAGANGTTIFNGGANINSLITAMGTGAGALALGVSNAAINTSTGGIVLTSSAVGTTISMVNAGTNLVDTPALATGTVTAAIPAAVGSAGGNGSVAGFGIITGGNPVDGNSDTLGGSLVLSNGLGGTPVTFTMGGSGGPTGSGAAIAVGGTTLNALLTAVNSQTSATDITATLNANDDGLTFSTSTLGTTIGVTSTGLTDASGFSVTNPSSGGAGQYASAVVALSDGGKISGNGGAGSGTLAGTITISNNGVSDTFVMGGAATASGADGQTYHTGGATLTSLINEINTQAGGISTLGLAATQDGASGGIFLQSTATGVTGLSATGTAGLTDTIDETGAPGSAGITPEATAIGANVIIGDATGNNQSDVLTGSIVLQNVGHGVGGLAETFTMGATSGTAESGIGTANITVGGNTLQALAQAITDASTNGTHGGGTITSANSLDFSTGIGANGLTITSLDTASVIAPVGAGNALKDAYGVTAAMTGGQPTIPATNASAVIGTSGTIQTTDTLNGSLVLSNGGAAQTFTMGSSANGGTTILTLAQAINDSTLGLKASTVNGALELQSSVPDTSIVMGGASNLTDTANEVLVGGTGQPNSTIVPGTPAGPSHATLNLASGTDPNGTFVLTGSVALTGTGGTETFTMGGNGGTDLSTLATNISDSGIGITAAATTTGLTLTMKSNGSTPISAVGTTTLHDTLGNAASTATLGTFRSESDALSNGVISFTMGSNISPTQIDVSTGETVSQLVTQINTGVSGLQTDPYGVHANWDSGTGNIDLTSDTYGTAGDISAMGSNVADTTAGQGLSYTLASAYGVGITNSSVAGGDALYDSSTQGAPSGPSAQYSNFVANTGGSSGIATMSYSDGAGESLSATDLSNQTDAESALTSLNQAITDVAAQDGYIGAQINTLNSVSSVLSTQQENVTSAQNAVQATDYAMATSNMSKYEILSQTGIAALAQANSIQQEVTKLLQ
jgi:flagellin